MRWIGLKSLLVMILLGFSICAFSEEGDGHQADPRQGLYGDIKVASEVDDHFSDQGAGLDVGYMLTRQWGLELGAIGFSDFFSSSTAGYFALKGVTPLNRTIDAYLKLGVSRFSRTFDFPFVGSTTDSYYTFYVSAGLQGEMTTHSVWLVDLTQIGGDRRHGFDDVTGISLGIGFR